MWLVASELDGVEKECFRQRKVLRSAEAGMARVSFAGLGRASGDGKECGVSGWGGGR